ncbi:MAG TPA: glycosyltransferase, partial [Acidimicrobiales bacterium]|nr:glycosyltransferase [Acidimicrobiales bacterium]
LLYLGTAKSHKNLPTLIAAHRRRPGLPPLVLAGPTAAEVAACGVAVRPGDRVRALGRVPDGAVAALLRGADAVALPSRREGVGLVALEAMACATAVVASDGEGVTDTVGDAALVVPAGDEEAWADALARVVGDEGLRTRLGACGRERALARTWPDAARAYIELFRAAAR